MSDLLNELLNEKKHYNFDKTSDDDSDDNGGKSDDDSDDDTEISTNEEMALRKMATMLNVLDESVTEEQLYEAVNIIRLNKQSKTLNLAHRTALLMAKAKGDPLYKSYAKFNGLRLKLREKIFAKYGSKANSRARALMAGSTVQPLSPSKK